MADLTKTENRLIALSATSRFVESILRGEQGPISADKRALYEDVMTLVEWIHELRDEPELVAEVRHLTALLGAVAAEVPDEMREASFVREAREIAAAG